MIEVLAQVRVEEFRKFWSVFTARGADMRKTHGSQGAEVFTHADDPTQVVILFRWESREALGRFLADPNVKATMQSSGTIPPPSFTFLKKVAELPA